MPQLPPRPRLEQLIAQAMKDAVPELYRELRNERTLASSVSERADVAEEVYEIAMSERYEILTRDEDPQARIEALSSLRRRATEAALAAATEF